MLCSYDNMRPFYNKYYKNLVTEEHFCGEASLFNKEHFYIFEINKLKYIGKCKDDYLNKMPFRINIEEPFSYGKEVYHLIEDFTPLKIVPSKDMSFADLVDSLGGELKHTHRLDYLCYRLIAIISYMDTIRVRFSTEPAFGKDSITWQLFLLTNNLVNFTPKTVTGIELQLKKPVVVMNELKDLNSDQRKYVSQLLHKITDDSPVYTRGAAKAKGLDLKSEYDLNNLSVMIFYNNRTNVGKQEEHFDDLFGKAVLDRIMPFQFKGSLDMEQFNDIRDFEDHTEEYLKIVHTLEYFRTVFDKNELPKVMFDTKGDLKGRHIPIFNRIGRWVELYCQERNYSSDVLLSNIMDAYRRHNGLLIESD